MGVGDPRYPPAAAAAARELTARRPGAPLQPLAGIDCRQLQLMQCLACCAYCTTKPRAFALPSAHPSQARAEPKKQEKLQRQSRYIAGLLGALTNTGACSAAPGRRACGACAGPRLWPAA